MAELKDHVFVFTGATFEAAMEAWMREQIAAYPHQEERIRVTALAMRDFLQSDAARRHKLMMRPGRD
ncbi:MAG: hypothetical protein WAK53_17550 [Chromatiaceae bacterium]|jgi:hypothetical protein